jgi:hypothetical protein
VAVLRSAPARGVAVVVLLAGLVGLAVWFGSLGPAPAVGAYPQAEALGSDYDRYVGQRAAVAGTIVATDPPVLEAADEDGQPVRYRLAGVEQPLQRDDGFWGFFLVEPDHTLRVERGIRFTAADHAYARGISLLAGLWVLARVLRDWRVDHDAAGLVPAGEQEQTPGDGGGDGGA